ncbi:MAG: histidinol-phosphatase [Clostridia bacterium]|nr:histidinol-phosphatase [Clostridia bacterium]
MIANYHTHTPRCHHAGGSEREYIENAIELGFCELGFADHAPMPFGNGHVSGIRMSLGETEDYVNTLLDLRREYEKDIKIFIGFEAEYYPAVFDRFIDFIGQYPIDYIIMGQHCQNNEYDGGWYGAPTESEDFLRAYVDQVTEGLSSGKFSYLAHPDLPNFKGDREIYQREMRRLIEYANGASIPLEINMLGAQEGRHYPNPDFWAVASELGATAIIGCDAHQPRDIVQNTDVERVVKLIESNPGLKILDTLNFKPIK